MISRWPLNTRGYAILLWGNVRGWLALVAMSGQVRWQNERYTMSAVASTGSMITFWLGALAKDSIACVYFCAMK